jgi:hypothetical protein
MAEIVALIGQAEPPVPISGQAGSRSVDAGVTTHAWSIEEIVALLG